MGPPDWTDFEFAALGLVLALRRQCQAEPPDAATAQLCANWEAELDALQEIRGGRNDCG